jgi:hypothetical protein
MDLPPSSGGEGGGGRSYSVGSGKSRYPPPHLSDDEERPVLRNVVIF